MGTLRSRRPSRGRRSRSRSPVGSQYPCAQVRVLRWITGRTRRVESGPYDDPVLHVRFRRTTPSSGRRRRPLGNGGGKPRGSTARSMNSSKPRSATSTGHSLQSGPSMNRELLTSSSRTSGQMCQVGGGAARVGVPLPVVATSPMPNVHEDRIALRFVQTSPRVVSSVSLSDSPSMPAEQAAPARGTTGRPWPRRVLGGRAGGRLGSRPTPARRRRHLAKPLHDRGTCASAPTRNGWRVGVGATSTQAAAPWRTVVRPRVTPWTGVGARAPRAKPLAAGEAPDEHRGASRSNRHRGCD